MERFKFILCLSILLPVFCLVSCDKDDVENTSDERLVGAWKLESVLYNVEIDPDDNYFETILEGVMKEPDVMYLYAFRDTIQFQESGLFLQSPEIMFEITDRMVCGLPVYYQVVGKEIAFTLSPVNSRSTPPNIAYEIVDDELLSIVSEFRGEDATLLKSHLKESGEFGSSIEDFKIKRFQYTQIYRKINNFPYDQE